MLRSKQISRRSGHKRRQRRLLIENLEVRRVLDAASVASVSPDQFVVVQAGETELAEVSALSDYGLRCV